MGKSHYQNFEPPFEIPDSWEWVRLGDIAYVAAGSTPEKSAFESTDVPYIKMYNLRNQAIDFEFKPQYIKREVHEGRLKRSMAYSGDLIMNIVGPPLGKLAIIPNCLNECNFNQAAVVIRPYLQKVIINPYLFNYLSELSEIRSISTKGSAGQDNISLTQSQNMRIALPPLSEQKRIVSSISTWFNIINTIDNSTNRIISNISSLKSRLLDLAISGKLVPQKSSDEPAIEALRRINPNFKPCDNPHYQQLPKGWCCTTIEDVCEIERGITFPASAKCYKQGKNLIGCIRTANVQEELDLSDLWYVNKCYTCGNRDKLAVENDIIMSTANSKELVGKICKVPVLEEPITFGGFVVRLRSIESISPLLYWILKQYFYSGKFLDIASQTTNIANISTKKLASMQIMLPPIQEQKRIISAIEKYMDILDRITAEL